MKMPEQQMADAYRTLTAAVAALHAVYEDHPELNGEEIPGDVQTSDVLPKAIEDWQADLEAHQVGMDDRAQGATEEFALDMAGCRRYFDR